MIQRRRYIAWAALVGVVSAGPLHAQRATQPEQRETEQPEIWEILRLGGQDVGYSHVTQRVVTEAARSLVETESVTNVRVKRFGQTMAQTLRVVARETPSGRLLDFTSELGAQTDKMRVDGRVVGDQLQLSVHSAGQVSRRELPWRDEYGSPFAMERTLRDAPPREGLRRVFQMFVPVYNQLAEVTLTAEEKAPVALLSGRRELRKVVAATKLPGGQTLTTWIWVDEAGEIWKTRLLGVDQETFRASRQRAFEAALTDFDLGEFTVVPLDPPAGFSRARTVTYRATVTNGDPTELFVNDGRQEVKPRDNHRALITIRRVPLATGERATFEPADLQANSLIQIDDPRIRRLAADVGPTETNPGRLAALLASYVHQRMRVTDSAQAFASAATVAESLQGDCTEHAVLLAALCRAREIPARVAIGLVYVKQLGGFAYHMWTEAWVEGDWVPLDATRPSGEIGVGHLKMAVSNLEGVSPYEAFLPVMRALGRLDLELVDITIP